MRVRIGIVSWNTRDLLRQCLLALPAATEGLSVDVVVVDNDSSDGSADLDEAQAAATVVRNPENVGYARAMNQALTLDTGHGPPDVLIALNPDTVPPPGSLTQLAQRLSQTAGVGLVAPRLENSDGSLQHSVYRFPSCRLAAIVGFVPLRWQRGRLARQWWLDGRAPHDRACDIDWAIGAVHAIRAEALGGERPYSERWFMYVEDLDLCWRLVQSGWRCRLEPDIHVVHVGNAAGAQAWGEDRTRRWLAASYDWYRLTFGSARTRRWALLNIGGVSAHLLGAIVSRFRGAQVSSGHEARKLWHSLPAHLDGLRGGSGADGDGRLGQNETRDHPVQAY